MKNRIYNKMYLASEQKLFLFGDQEDTHFPKTDITESVLDNLFGENHNIWVNAQVQTYKEKVICAFLADRAINDDEFSLSIFSETAKLSSRIFGIIWNFVTGSSYSINEKMEAIERLKRTNQYSLLEQSDIVISKYNFANNIETIVEYSNETQTILKVLLDKYFDDEDYVNRYFIVSSNPNYDFGIENYEEKYFENLITYISD